MSVAAEFGASPPWFFAFRMATVGFDPRTVSIVSPVEVADDLVSPVLVTVPRCWRARAKERNTRGLAALYIRGTAMRLGITPKDKRWGGKKSSHGPRLC
jgi:hypothetical protein